MKYSVVVPCYNEEAVIRTTHTRLTEVMKALDDDYEIIYINDGSRDATGDILREIIIRDDHAKALMFAANRGHQIAVTAGLDYASGDAVVIIDADLQDPPEVIPEMIERWKKGAQVVYGQRKRREGETFFKKATASVYYRFLARMTGGMIPRDTGDFRLVDKKVVEAIRQMPEHDRFLRGMFAWIGFKQEAVLYDRDKRFAGESHYPLRKMLQLAANGLFSFSMTPLKWVTFSGCVWSGIGILGLIITLIVSLCGVPVGLWALAALCALLTGCTILCAGIVGEYIGRIYNEARRRPLYFIADAPGFDINNKNNHPMEVNK